MPTLEVCVDTHAGVMACVDGGADRIELCAALALGGLTPSVGLMQMAAKCGMPTVAMVRPRAGGFAYSRDEIESMSAEIAAARDCGLDGVVCGASTPDGVLDMDALRVLRTACGAMPMTLHRVVDILDDTVKAVDAAIELGCVRILTSGGQKKAVDGCEMLQKMHQTAAGRIEITAGSGINANNVVNVAARTGILAFHASCAVSQPTPDKIADMAFDGPETRQTDAETIAKMQRVLASMV